MTWPDRIAIRLWLRRLVAWAAIAYLVAMVACVVLLRCVGERWWLTGAGLYFPRFPFAVPWPFLFAAVVFYRMPRMIAGQAVAGVIVLFPLMGFVVPVPRLHAAHGPSMRVLSFNTNLDHAGVPAIIAAIDRHSPDLVLLQEIVVGASDPMMTELRARYQNVNATGQFVVASRFTLTSVNEPERFEFGGRLHSPRYMRYVGETPLGAMTIFNVHPVSPREDFYKIRGAGLRREILSGRLFQGAASPTVQANSGLRTGELEALLRAVHAETGPTLVAGDTNLPGLSPLLAMFGAGFTDGFRQAGAGFGYTFPARLPWMRIDRMFASSPLRFDRFQVDCRGASDHLCVVADVSAP